MPNKSLDTDTQLGAAPSARVLCAGQRQRYASFSSDVISASTSALLTCCEIQTTNRAYHREEVP